MNDESVEGMTTAEIIDLLRIIRGSIVLVVKRPRIWTVFDEIDTREFHIQIQNYMRSQESESQ